MQFIVFEVFSMLYRVTFTQIERVMAFPQCNLAQLFQETIIPTLYTIAAFPECAWELQNHAWCESRLPALWIHHLI